MQYPKTSISKARGLGHRFRRIKSSSFPRFAKNFCIGSVLVLTASCDTGGLIERDLESGNRKVLQIQVTPSESNPFDSAQYALLGTLESDVDAGKVSLADTATSSLLVSLSGVSMPLTNAEALTIATEIQALAQDQLKEELSERAASARALGFTPLTQSYIDTLEPTSEYLSDLTQLVADLTAATPTALLASTDAERLLLRSFQSESFYELYAVEAYGSDWVPPQGITSQDVIDAFTSFDTIRNQSKSLLANWMSSNSHGTPSQDFDVLADEFETAMATINTLVTEDYQALAVDWAALGAELSEDTSALVSLQATTESARTAARDEFLTLLSDFQSARSVNDWIGFEDDLATYRTAEASATAAVDAYIDEITRWSIALMVDIGGDYGETSLAEASALTLLPTPIDALIPDIDLVPEASAEEDPYFDRSYTHAGMRFLNGFHEAVFGHSTGGDFGSHTFEHTVDSELAIYALQEGEDHPLPEPQCLPATESTLEGLCKTIDPLINGLPTDQNGLPDRSPNNADAYCKAAEALAKLVIGLKATCELLDCINSYPVAEPAGVDQIARQAACDVEKRIGIEYASEALICFHEAAHPPKPAGEENQEELPLKQACINLISANNNVATHCNTIATLGAVKDYLEGALADAGTGGIVGIDNIIAALQTRKDTIDTEIGLGGSINAIQSAITAQEKAIKKVKCELEIITGIKDDRNDNEKNKDIADTIAEILKRMGSIAGIGSKDPSSVAGALGDIINTLTDIDDWLKGEGDEARRVERAKKLRKRLCNQLKVLDYAWGALQRTQDAKRKEHKKLCDVIEALEDDKNAGNADDAAKKTAEEVVKDIEEQIATARLQKFAAISARTSALTDKRNQDPATGSADCLGLTPIIDYLRLECGSGSAGEDTGIGYNPPEEWIAAHIDGKCEAAKREVNRDDSIADDDKADEIAERQAMIKEKSGLSRSSTARTDAQSALKTEKDRIYNSIFGAGSSSLQDRVAAEKNKIGELIQKVTEKYSYNLARSGQSEEDDG